VESFADFGGDADLLFAALPDSQEAWHAAAVLLGFSTTAHEHVVSRNMGIIVLARYQGNPVAGAIHFYGGPPGHFTNLALRTKRFSICAAAIS